MIANEPGGCTATANGFGWQGSIDEFKLYDRALSGEELQSIYNAGSAGVCKGEAANMPNQTPLPAPDERFKEAHSGTLAVGQESTDICFHCSSYNV